MSEGDGDIEVTDETDQGWHIFDLRQNSAIKAVILLCCIICLGLWIRHRNQQRKKKYLHQGTNGNGFHPYPQYQRANQSTAPDNVGLLTRLEARMDNFMAAYISPGNSNSGYMPPAIPYGSNGNNMGQSHGTSMPSAPPTLDPAYQQGSYGQNISSSSHQQSYNNSFSRPQYQSTPIKKKLDTISQENEIDFGFKKEEF